MSQRDRFESQFARCWPPDSWKDVTVLLAVSGGADSMALLHAAAAVRRAGAGRLMAAHFNHGLRGAESDADQEFVVAACRAFYIPCRVGRADRGGAPPKSADRAEQAARNSRYAFLQIAASEAGARLLATAHTADDQAETILHRVIRGAGLRGVAGIPRTRPLTDLTQIVRPLLDFRRDQLRSYLQRIGATYREDSSNRDFAYTRNRIRHDLLPRLTAEYNEKTVEALLRLGELAGEAQSEIDQQAAHLLEASVEFCSGDCARIDCASLDSASEFLRREILIGIWSRQGWPQQAMGLAEWRCLAALLDEHANPAARHFPGGIRARRDENRLTLERVSPRR